VILSAPLPPLPSRFAGAARLRRFGSPAWEQCKDVLYYDVFRCPAVNNQPVMFCKQSAQMFISGLTSPPPVVSFSSSSQNSLDRYNLLPMHSDLVELPAHPPVLPGATKGPFREPRSQETAAPTPGSTPPTLTKFAHATISSRCEQIVHELIGASGASSRRRFLTAS
jgi:hypothetical protein